MRTLLKNGTVVNVFTGQLDRADVLIEDRIIVGLDLYDDADADKVVDCTGKYICPGFIDGHVHIESSMLTPSEMTRACVPHGTTAIVADPHEIANVSGANGIQFLIDASEGLPMTVYFALPSCVPASPFDESGAVLDAKDLEPFYKNPRVVSLGEMMNFPDLVAGDKGLIEKCKNALANGRIIDGHAPLLSGKALDRYISYGVSDDHECSRYEEALEKLRKGQWVMVRQDATGSILDEMRGLYENPQYAARCLMVSDDTHPADLLKNGHLDHFVRQATSRGINPVTCIQMLTLHPAQCFNLRHMGAVAPGYYANVLILNNLDSMDVKDVYYYGEKVSDNKKIKDFKDPEVSKELMDSLLGSVHVKDVTSSDFRFAFTGKKNCRMIKVEYDQFVSDEIFEEVDFDKNSGIDLDRDILKIAVLERHNYTGHIGLGFIKGIGLKEGAIAATVAHDAHNVIVIGTSDEEMVAAVNAIKEVGGGFVSVRNGKILEALALPISGLINPGHAQDVADDNAKVRESTHVLGADPRMDPYFKMVFISLTVIPHIKICTKGYVNVDTFRVVPLIED